MIITQSNMFFIQMLVDRILFRNLFGLLASRFLLLSMLVFVYVYDAYNHCLVKVILQAVTDGN